MELVSQMTKEDLRMLIDEALEQKLIEFFGVLHLIKVYVHLFFKMVIGKFMSVMVTYGAAHASVRLHDFKTHDGQKDALLGTKISSVIASGFFGPSLFPIYMYNDVNRVYMYLNNLNPTDYGYKTQFNDITDILFT